MNGMIDFYDANSPNSDSVLEHKSSIHIESNIALSDNYENIILHRYHDSKLICNRHRQVYNPHYELVRVKDSETTIDELLSQVELSYKDDS